jgi:hypothetical protein
MMGSSIIHHQYDLPIRAGATKKQNQELLESYGVKGFSLAGDQAAVGWTDSAEKLPSTSGLGRDKARDRYFPGESTWRTESHAAENGIHPRTTSQRPLFEPVFGVFLYVAFASGSARAIRDRGFLGRNPR